MCEEVIKKTFEELGLSEKTLQAIKRKGFEEPSEIQALCIPLLLKDGTEVIGQAETGTGKTAAFALPILETIDEERKDVQALILTPTRELALQVAEEINSLKPTDKIECAPIYGGASMENQIRKLKKGVQIVVGTPGRILDHIKRKTLDLSRLSFMVLDEADEMLDMGFIEDIEEVLKTAPENKRMLMFSATIPPQIQKLASSFMKNAITVRTQSRDSATKSADQIYYEVREADKIEALTRIIDRHPEFYGVIFCRTKLQCDEVGHILQERGYDAEALHGDLSQREREIILRKMREKTIRILVATDVAARGLDIQDLTHVINYSLPHDAEIYIHRVGRTGRAGKEGTAITFITPSEARRFSYIKKASKAEIRKEEIPTPKEVVERKRELILEELESATEEKVNEEFVNLAHTLISKKELPEEELIGLLLQHFYKDSLDITQYKDIATEKKAKEKKSTKKKANSDKDRPYDKVHTPSMDENGLTRLFIARGKNDGVTKRGLVEFIESETGVKDRDLKDILVMDEYSFINAPYDTAEIILSVFSKKKYNGRTIVEKAKEERSKRKKEDSQDKKKRERKNKDYDEKALLEWERKVEKSRKSSSKKKSKDKKEKSKTKRGRRS